MKEQTIVLNVMEGMPGEVLERARDYTIRKDDRGMVRATFQNPSMEEAAVKMTLTGLNPGAVFEISIGRQVQSLQFKKANSAGILETKWIIPENSVLQVCEVKSRKTDRSIKMQELKQL